MPKFADSGSLNSSSAPTLTKTASSASSVTVVAANSGRSRGVVYNDSTAILYLLYGNAAAASTANDSVQIPAQGTHNIIDGYGGILAGIWAAANGFAYITEIV